MNLMDIVALAKQGYTPSDIRELINMSEDVPAADQPEEAEQKTAPEEVQKVEAEDDQSNDAIDYKALYEEEKAKNDQLSGDLQKAQNKNVTVDLSDKSDTTDTDLIGDLVRSFM